jgi:hypothetical protein
MRIDTSKITGWSVASKTRPIKAKPLISLMVDRKVAIKFLVDTLEGHEPLGDGSIICVGEAGDVWQQTQKKLLQKYVVKAIDSDGWMDCEPLPDNAVNAIEVNSAFIQALTGVLPSPMNSDFTIIGQWGATVNGEKNVQKGSSTGDFICQNQTDPTDVWIVKRKLFMNTYIIKS